MAHTIEVGLYVDFSAVMRIIRGDSKIPSSVRPCKAVRDALKNKLVRVRREKEKINALFGQTEK